MQDDEANRVGLKNIGIITLPIGRVGLMHLSNFIKVIKPNTDSISIITSSVEGVSFDDLCKNEIYLKSIVYKSKNNCLLRILLHIFLQLSISVEVIKLLNRVDIWIFFLDSHVLLLPIISSKLSGKKIIFALGASFLKSSNARKDFLSGLLTSMTSICYSFSDRIVIYSNSVVKVWDLERHMDKIIVADRHFLDFDKFSMIKEFRYRPNFIGYIGRLSEEKGILNLIRAIPEINRHNNKIKILIVGDGPLKDFIINYIKVNTLSNSVVFQGWIPHEELGTYLNELKLIVLPSYTEGIPNVMLEAMACGTPVIAAPVGSIPDIIRDGETGILLKGNSSNCISQTILQCLENPDLELIGLNARAMVKKEFSYDTACNNWRKVLKNMVCF